MTNQYDVIIIGAGASGLMCAAQAGFRGKKTLVIDSAKRAGRKILISGGGKCNFTNYDISAQNYLCQNPHFVKSALSQYTNWDFLALIHQYQIEFEERDHGQLFCLDSAKQIVEMLVDQCNKAQVQFRYQTQIEKITPQAFGFELTLGQQKLYCQSLVVATGGLSMPKLGATPFGYKLAEQFGLSIIPTSAGLVPFTLHLADKNAFADLSGIAIPVEISTQNGARFKEALLFTHRGLSGPAILQISSYWQAGETITINLVPEHNLMETLTHTLQEHPNQSLKNTLSKILPKRLVEALITRHQWTDKPLKQINQNQIKDLAHLLENYPLKPNGTEGYRTAEVTRGGVDTDHFSSKTMECKTIKGLYFIGEVMDVTGWLGGYNFQWAWSSGFVAGQYC